MTVPVRWLAARPDVYGLVAGDSLTNISRASQIAERIVDDLAQRGWPSGEVLGSEKGLASRYGVGANIIRQALRMLEVRGLGRTRRGPAGGLVVARTTREQLVTALVQNLGWSGLLDEDIDDAIDAIQTQVKRLAAENVQRHSPRGRSAEAPLTLILDSLRQFGSRRDFFNGFGDSALQDKKQAIQVAMLLLKEASRERCAAGYYLGSVPQLSEKFGVDPRIVVQATRLISDFGVARVQRGRAGGLFLRDPGCATLVRLVHAHMAAQQLSTGDVHECLWVLNIIHTRRAAERDLAPEHFLDAEEAVMSASPDLLPYFWVQLQQEIAYAAAIPALHMFARCFVAFGIRKASAAAPPRSYEIADLRSATQDVICAIRKRDPDAAERAQMLCHDIIDDYSHSGTTGAHAVH